MDGLRRGKESEEIAAKALERGLAEVPDLVYIDKAGTWADIGGVDFFLGIKRSGGRVVSIGLQIKSSSSARRNTVERLVRGRSNGHENPTDDLCDTLIVISVPREGTEEERIVETLRRIMYKAGIAHDRRPLRA